METLRGFPVFVSWDLRHFVILPYKTVHLSTEKMYVRRAMVNSKKVQTVLYKKIKKKGPKAWDRAQQNNSLTKTLGKTYPYTLQGAAGKQGQVLHAGLAGAGGKHKIIT